MSMGKYYDIWNTLENSNVRNPPLALLGGVVPERIVERQLEELERSLTLQVEKASWINLLPPKTATR